MVTDPIADFLVQVQNAYLAGKKTVSVPYSQMKSDLAKILVDEKYIEKKEITGDSKNASPAEKMITMQLRYTDGEPAIEKVRRISKPGRRLYTSKDEIPSVLTGFGTAIISTSKGLMTDTKARKKGVGGEVICYVW